MTRSDGVLSSLEAAVPDAQIIEDVRRVLVDNSHNGVATIELNEPNSVQVPVDVRIETIAKSFFNRHFDDNLPMGYSAQVAIGGVTKREFGIIHTRYIALQRSTTMPNVRCSPWTFTKTCVDGTAAEQNAPSYVTWSSTVRLSCSLDGLGSVRALAQDRSADPGEPNGSVRCAHGCEAHRAVVAEEVF
jgi:hypothetical protein